jgi:hypothetical protein
MVGNGGEGILEMPNGKWLFADTFYGYVKTMYDQMKFKDLVVYLDSGVSELFFNEFAQ